jgi:hypothetical protein
MARIMPMQHGVSSSTDPIVPFASPCADTAAPPVVFQVLEELAISLKHNLVSKLPFCAFNGGNDVFVDVGNKSLGLDALMRYLDAYPYEVRRRLTP